MESLGSRHKEYEDAYDLKITRRLPVIIRCDGRSFHSLTKKLNKPYCSKMLNLMATTMIHSAMEIDGIIFAYQQSDEITFVLRNDLSLDSEPWFKNRIQKLVSVTSSIVTLAFMKNLVMMEGPPEIVGDATFDARVFAVPSISEAANNLIFRQQDCIKNSINMAAQAELIKVLGKKQALELLHEKKGAEKINLLKSKCNINYETYYPAAFRRGVAAYKVPTISNENALRNKWHLNFNIPSFVEDRNFVLNILHSGHDVFRQ